jgi:hypothetical protein
VEKGTQLCPSMSKGSETGGDVDANFYILNVLSPHSLRSVAERNRHFCLSTLGTALESWFHVCTMLRLI